MNKLEKARILLVLLLPFGMMGGFLFSACRPGPEALPFRPLREPQAWTLPTEQPAYLILTEGNWRQYYTSPPVGSNFKDNFYVLASWGIKPNPGYRISIAGIDRSGNTMNVRVRLQEPDPKRVYAQVLVHPLAVAEIGNQALRQAGALTFVFQDQKGNGLARLRAEF